MIEAKESSVGIKELINELNFGRLIDPLQKKLDAMVNKYESLVKMVANLEDKKRDLNNEVKAIVKDIDTFNTMTNLTSDGLIEFVISISCKIFCIHKDILMSKYRGKNAVSARRFIYIHLRDNTNLSLTDIGAIFNKNHATIIHSITSHEWDVQFDTDYKRKFEAGLLLIDNFIKDEKN